MTMTIDPSLHRIVAVQPYPLEGGGASALPRSAGRISKGFWRREFANRHLTPALSPFEAEREQRRTRTTICAGRMGCRSPHPDPIAI